MSHSKPARVSYRKYLGNGYSGTPRHRTDTHHRELKSTLCISGAGVADEIFLTQRGCAFDTPAFFQEALLEIWLATAARSTSSDPQVCGQAAEQWLQALQHVEQSTNYVILPRSARFPAITDCFFHHRGLEASLGTFSTDQGK